MLNYIQSNNNTNPKHIYDIESNYNPKKECGFTQTVHAQNMQRSLI